VIKAMAEGSAKEAVKVVEKTKASVRAFVEHPFHIVKNLFRHRKVRCRGLAKNGHQLYKLFGRANVVIAARTPAAVCKKRVDSGCRRAKSAEPRGSQAHMTLLREIAGHKTALPIALFPPTRTQIRELRFIQRFL